jgi:hypothetical protein
VFKVNSLGSYVAGIATVVIALGTGFAGGALVGSSWGGIERPPVVAMNEYRVNATGHRREIPLVQAVALEFPDEQAIAANAKAIKAAAARKDAAQQRKTARAEQRKIAERSRQIALIEAARRTQASEIASTNASRSPDSSLGSSLGFAPQAHSQQSFGN